LDLDDEYGDNDEHDVPRISGVTALAQTGMWGERRILFFIRKTQSGSWPPDGNTPRRLVPTFDSVRISRVEPVG